MRLGLKLCLGLAVLGVGNYAYTALTHLWSEHQSVKNPRHLEMELGAHYIDVRERSGYPLEAKFIPLGGYDAAYEDFNTGKDDRFWMRILEGDKVIEFPWLATRKRASMDTGVYTGFNFHFENFAQAQPRDEQTNILQPLMYEAEKTDYIHDEKLQSIMGSNDDFKSFINALNTWGGRNFYGGLNAVFEADLNAAPKLYNTQQDWRGNFQTTEKVLLADQAFIYPFTNYQADFTIPEVRIPWFQEVLHRFMDLEKDGLPWNSLEKVNPTTCITYSGQSQLISDVSPRYQSDYISHGLSTVRSYG